MIKFKSIMKNIILLLILANFSYLQDVQKIEYYFDEDPGYGMGTTIPFTNGYEVDVEYDIDISALSNGFHTLYIRSAYDNGCWSHNQPQHFYKDPLPQNPPDITSIDYVIMSQENVLGTGSINDITPGVDVDIQTDILIPEMENVSEVVFQIKAVNSLGIPSQNFNHSLSIIPDAVYGCMDPTANNYSPDANVDDGTCEYVGNYALYFDGQNNLVEIEEANLFDLSDFTYQAWTKVEQTNDWRSIIDIDNDKQLLAIASGNYTLWGRCGNVNIGEVQDGWHHLAWTVSGNNFNFYIDGSLVYSGAGCSDGVDGNYLMIGSGLGGNEYFSGTIDDVRIWNRALSGEEIASSMFNPGFGLDDGSMVGYWNFNIPSGTILFDNSGNNNHGEINGATWTIVSSGCTDVLANNYDQNAEFDDGSCEYETVNSLTFNYTDGNNLISFPGFLENDNTIDFLYAVEEDGPDIFFIIGQGVGTFDVLGEWSGNLNNISPFSGYWLNVTPESEVTIEFEDLIENCTIYPTSDGNNLISFYWGGANSVPTLDALGGEANALENFHFIVGQGVGLFNNGDSFGGNLNNLEQGKGYWINLINDIEFSWGFDNCGAPPEGTLTKWVDPFINIPEEYRFTQSTEQAFYLIENIDCAEEGDILLAFCNDNLVGSIAWTGEYTPVPVMGIDPSPQTEGFCKAGDIPQFKLLTARNSKLESLVSSDEHIPGWSSLGVFHLESLTNQSVEIPSEFFLTPAYPNPFNPVTTISFGVPESETSHIMSLHIYDITGRKIETLIDGAIKPGYHTLEWHAEGLPSGVYIIRLEAQNFVSSQKLLLLK